jgi:hypothetical protein
MKQIHLSHAHRKIQGLFLNIVGSHSRTKFRFLVMIIWKFHLIVIGLRKKRFLRNFDLFSLVGKFPDALHRQ